MPRPAVTFFFSSCGCAEELAEAPEAIDMPVVLWQVGRCTGAEDFAGGAEVLKPEEFVKLEELGQLEKLTMRA